jgi:hypothetical protein
LGPEGTTTSDGVRVVVVFLAQAFMNGTSVNGFPRVLSGGLLECGVVGVWGFCLLFENCTVDASIFVVKFIRANGGCLGTRSR